MNIYITVLISIIIAFIGYNLGKTVAELNNKELTRLIGLQLNKNFKEYYFSPYNPNNNLLSSRAEDTWASPCVRCNNSDSCEYRDTSIINCVDFIPKETP